MLIPVGYYPMRRSWYHLIRASRDCVVLVLHNHPSLVGLQGVKDEIQSLVNLIRIRKLRETMGLPQMDMSYHMVFTGAPGTGKTTVARLVAKIYRELGILSKGTFIETDRSSCSLRSASSRS